MNKLLILIITSTSLTFASDRPEPAKPAWSLSGTEAQDILESMAACSRAPGQEKTLQDHNNSLHLAIFSGNIAYLNKALADGANPSSTNLGGQTALMQAIIANRAPAIKILLAAGADIYPKDRHGETAFDYAAKDAGVRREGSEARDARENKIRDETLKLLIKIDEINKQPINVDEIKTQLNEAINSAFSSPN